MVITKQHIDFLTLDEEFALFVKIKKGNKKAEQDVITAHIPLAEKLAREMTRASAFEVEDLENEAILGLYDAISKFDHTRNVRFNAFAKIYIRGAVLRYIMDNWSIVKNGSRAFKEAFFRNKRSVEALKARGMDMSGVVDDTSSFTEVSAKNMISHRDDSLNAPIGEEEGFVERVDMLVDPASIETSAEDRISNQQYFDAFNEVLSEMSEQKLAIVRERMLADKKMALRALAEKLNISHETIRTIEDEIITDVKIKVEDNRKARAEEYRNNNT